MDAINRGSWHSLFSIKIEIEMELDIIIIEEERGLVCRRRIMSGKPRMTCLTKTILGT